MNTVAAVLTQLPPGWKIIVELESITWDDMKKLVAIAEGMGWLNSDVQFDFEKLDDSPYLTPVAIRLEDI